jgi:hypothetical protein
MAYSEYVDSNTGITIIVTTQAPDALPIGKNLELSTNWQEVITVPQFKVPELVFGGSTTIEPGVGEVISPLIIANKTANTATVDVKVFRYVGGNEYYLVRNMPVPGYDTIPIPLNGQFFASGDTLEVKSNANTTLDATLSFTLGQAEEYDVD